MKSSSGLKMLDPITWVLLVSPFVVVSLINSNYAMPYVMLKILTDCYMMEMAFGLVNIGHYKALIIYVCVFLAIFVF